MLGAIKQSLEYLFQWQCSGTAHGSAPASTTHNPAGNPTHSYNLLHQQPCQTWTTKVTETHNKPTLVSTRYCDFESIELRKSDKVVVMWNPQISCDKSLYKTDNKHKTQHSEEK